jgi:acyl transferase domain-containing protein
MSAEKDIARLIAALDTATDRIEELERARSEPIAIVAMGCRYPGGATNPDAFWRLLEEGRDAVGEFPADRWPIEPFYAEDFAAPGRINTRRGGFIDEIAGFDPDLFGMTPREALTLDPQQRLLMEACWEAFEEAGYTRERLKGRRAGVFVGISNNDYMRVIARAGLDRIDPYYITGNSLNAVAGRIAFWLGFTGPTLAIDTACSSSLVALHTACQSLRADDCEMALACGVNLILAPEVWIGLAKLGALSPDGRCRAFSAEANGFGRGEGIGVVVLKRLSHAQRDGNRVLAVIRGSAVNQDGASSGLTVPNALAHEEVIRSALRAARLSPDEVDWIECHGTGTPIGDPIEVRALRATYGAAHSAAAPLVISTVKTNIAHGECSAGIAAVIKIVLALRHGMIPRHLHCETLSSQIEWGDGEIAVPTAARAWSRGPRPRIAGASAFGVSGANAHVLIEEAPASAASRPAATRSRTVQPLVLSGATVEGLRAVAGRWAEEWPEGGLGDAAYSAATRRSALAQRLALAGGDAAVLRDRLRRFAAGEEVEGVSTGVAIQERPARGAWLFTGQGAQQPGMGRALYESEPVFREALERAAGILRDHLDRPLLDLIFPPPDGDPNALHETQYSQPVLFSLQYALGELWRSWGVEPSVVMGHSMGEYGAACRAGVFSLEDGLKLAATRGRLVQSLPRNGEMAAVLGREDRVREGLAGLEDRVSIAAVNGPENTVISGERAAVGEAVARFTAAGLTVKPLKISHAFHSPLLNPILEEFRAVAGSVDFRPPAIPIVSNLTGAFAGPEIATPDYWVEHLLKPVRFTESIDLLHREGERLFIEIGPHPTLLGLARQCVVESSSSPCRWLTSLRRDHDAAETILGSLGELWAAGFRVDWESCFAGLDLAPVRLPLYPFCRRRFWFEVDFSPDAMRDEDLYGIDWRPRSWSAPERVEGRWLIVTAPGDVGAALSAGLVARGAEVVTAESGDRFERIGEKRWVIRSSSVEDHERLIAEAVEAGFAPERIVLTGGTAPAKGELFEEAVELASGTAAHLKALVRARQADATRAWVVTRGVVALNGDSAGAGSLQKNGGDGGPAASRADHALGPRGRGPSIGPGAARMAPPSVDSVGEQHAVPLRDDFNNVSVSSVLWGLGRTVAAEAPGHWGGLIDLAMTADATSALEADAIIAAILNADGENQVAWREGGHRVPRLVRMKNLPEEAPALTPDGARLVTGGLTGLGLAFAEWLVEHGATRIILCGRRAPGEEALSAIARMEAHGAEVLVLSADMARADDVERLFAAARERGWTIRGIYHSAGVIDDATLPLLDADRFRRVMAPKIAGVINLDRAARDLDLEDFVLFSSASALFGSPGQGNYAAANAFLDAFAHARRAAGRPALSVNWGPWSETGLAARLSADHRSQLGSRGIRPFTTARGLALLGRLLASPAPQVGAVGVDWETFGREVLGTVKLPLVEDLCRSTIEEEAGPAERSIREILAAGSGDEANAAAVAWLEARVRRVLGLGPDRLLDRAAPLISLGLDSMMATELKNRVVKEIGVNIPIARFIDGSSIEKVAAIIVATAAPEMEEVTL